MNNQAEETTPVSDIVKHVFSILLVIAGVTAFYYFSDVRFLFRVLGLLLIAVMAVGLFLTTGQGKKIWLFILESKQEVRKVVWPTREETVRTTLLVFAMVVIVGLLLGVLDKVLFEAIRWVTGQKG